MIKVLFVDDEADALEGLQRVIQAERPEWECGFARGAAVGMETLSSTPYDAVIVDLRISNASALLRYTADHSPATVRIALSGQSDMGGLLQTVRFAHIFLTKPCDAATMIYTLDRVNRLRMSVTNPSLRALVGGVASLPTAPLVYAALERAVLSPDANTVLVAKIVEKNIALTAKILQLVNSAFFGFARANTSIEHAVSFLGFTILRALVLSHEIAEVFPGKQISGFSLEDHEKHALFVASIARKLVRDRVRGDEAFIAAMLHDVGNLMLASRAPDQFSKVVKTALERNVPQYVIERETLGITHAEVGAYLLGLWGIPFTITEAVANHHSPSTVPAASPADDVLVSVHVANALAHELTDGELVHQSLLDEDFLTRIGMIDELPRWRAIATEQYERVRDVISS